MMPEATKTPAEVARELSMAKLRIAELERALRRAAMWGIASKRYHAGTAFDLGQWVEYGMTESLPELPRHIQLAEQAEEALRQAAIVATKG